MKGEEVDKGSARRGEGQALERWEGWEGDAFQTTSRKSLSSACWCFLYISLFLSLLFSTLALSVSMQYIFDISTARHYMMVGGVGHTLLLVSG